MANRHSTWPQSARAALAGIWVTVCHERNMRIHLWFLALVSLIEAVLRPPFWIVVMILAVSAFVLTTELLNTAIENAVDLAIRNQYHPVAKAAKDSAAGATLIAASAAVAVGVLFLVRMWPWRFRLFSGVHLIGAMINVGIIIVTLLTLVLSRSTYIKYRQLGRKGKGGNRHGES